MTGVEVISSRQVGLVALPLLLVLTSCGEGSLTLATFENRDEQVFSGTIEQQEIRVGSKAGGRVREVLVREGERVEPGQPLVSFDTAELETLVLQAEARVRQQSARLARLEKGPRSEERAQARANSAAARAGLDAVRNWPRAEERAQAESAVAASEAELGQAQAVYDRIRRLQGTGDVSRQDFDAARFRLDQATARAAVERQRLELLRKGSRVEEISQAEERYRLASAAERLVLAGARSEEVADARAQLAEARARLEQVRLQRQEGTVIAPSRARIEVLPVRPGDLLAPNQVVARLLEEDRVWVRIYVPEPRLGLIAVGQRAEIRIDTFTDRTFAGSIEQINSQGEFTPRNIQSRDERNHQVFGVKIRIDNRDGVLKSGMAAEVRVLARSDQPPK
ncbi:MAG: HlyD family efflux transporter periplasmic adaptor subunit [Acidobacteria bacterium]|nr:HlyD family efflux transporter periplasmic adaptor subunit [Acidobacteriota bacterium]